MGRSDLISLGAAAAFAVVAVISLVVGLRGRRVGTHPHCRRCGFDLFGLPTDRTACPECGANTKRRRATVTGGRERRRRLVRVATVLLVGSVVWLGVGGWSIARRVDWQRHFPVWWLAREAEAGTPAARAAAFAELRRRLREDAIAANQTASLVERALAHQADRTRPWVPDWGGLVEAAHARKRVTDDQWRRYVRNAVGFDVHVRPRVRRGDLIPVRLTTRPPRTGSIGMSVSGAVTATLPGVPGSWDGNIQSHASGDRPSAMYPFVGGVRVTPDEDGWRRLPDGPHAVGLRFRGSVNASGLAAPAEFDLAASDTFVVVPADTQTVEHVADPAVVAAAERAIRVDQVRLGPDRNVYYDLKYVGLPVDVAATVVFRGGGREWAMGGGMLIRRGSGSAHIVRRNVDDFPDFLPDLVDVIFRPDDQAAYMTPDVTAIVGRELVARQVPVWRDVNGDYVRPQPLTRPSE